MPGRALLCPDLVGRDEELDELVQCRLAAARGNGRLVVISGHAGIGKSRLLSAFREKIRGSRSAVGTGLCREFGSAPYGAVLEALRSAGSYRALSTAGSRLEQLTQLIEFVSELCARRSVVLLLEDVHWADDGTLLFLNQLLPAVSSLRLLVVATYRSDDARRIRELEPYLGRIVRDHSTHAVDLRPLSGAEMRRLIRLALGNRHALPQELVDDIIERSDGNPFFAEELLENALSRNSSSRPGELPLTVRATVLERIRGLDPVDREVLTRASVFGRRFDAELFSQIFGMPRNDVLNVLRRLRSLQLIDELPSGSQYEYAFRHALTQHAIYGELLAEEARPLHAQILPALEVRGAPSGDLGYHAWAAANDEKSLIYNERAGDEAHALHVYGEAVRCFDRAARAAKTSESRASLLEKSGRSCASDGKAAQAADRYAQAADALAASGHDDRARALHLLMSAQARISGDTRRAETVLQQALQSMDQSQHAESAGIRLSLAYLLLDRGDVAAGKSLIADSAAAEGTPSYHNAVQYAEIVAGDISAFRIASERNVAVHAALGDHERLRVMFNRAFGHAILGFDDDALREFDAILPELAEKRLASLEILTCANAALIHTRAARFAAAKSCIERAAAVPETTTTGPIALAAAALGLGFATSDDDLVSRLCSADIVEAAFSSHINSTLGRIAGPYARWLAGKGDLETAKSILSRAMQALKSPFGATQTLIAAAEFGDDDTLASALAHLKYLEAMADVPLYAVTAHHLRALRALHAGDDSAKAIFARKAAEIYETLGWPMHQAACIEIAGDAKRAAARYRSIGATGPMRHLKVAAPAYVVAGTLSRREREIASLVASGTVNRQIAARLAVNQRTVEKHLTAIYAKLGLRNRSELAAYVTRHDRRAAPRPSPATASAPSSEAASGEASAIR